MVGLAEKLKWHSAGTWREKDFNPAGVPTGDADVVCPSVTSRRITGWSYVIQLTPGSVRRSSLSRDSPALEPRSFGGYSKDRKQICRRTPLLECSDCRVAVHPRRSQPTRRKNCRLPKQRETASLLSAKRRSTDRTHHSSIQLPAYRQDRHPVTALPRTTSIPPPLANPRSQRRSRHLQPTEVALGSPSLSLATMSPD